MAFGTSAKEQTKNLKLPRQAALQTDPACPMTLNLTSRLKPGQRVFHFSDSPIKLKSDGIFIDTGSSLEAETIVAAPLTHETSYV